MRQRLLNGHGHDRSRPQRQTRTKHQTGSSRPLNSIFGPFVHGHKRGEVSCFYSLIIGRGYHSCSIGTSSLCLDDAQPHQYRCSTWVLQHQQQQQPIARARVCLQQRCWYLHLRGDTSISRFLRGFSFLLIPNILSLQQPSQQWRGAEWQHRVRCFSVHRWCSSLLQCNLCMIRCNGVG